MSRPLLSWLLAPSVCFAAWAVAPGCQPAAPAVEPAPVTVAVVPSSPAPLASSLVAFEPPHDCEQKLDSSGPVVFSPDSKRLAVGNDTAAIFLLDLGSGAARVLVGESARTRALLFSSDGASLVSVADPTTGSGDVYVWDLPSGKLRNHGGTFCFQQAILAPDNSWVATVGCHGGFDVLETAAGGKSWSAARPPMRSAAASDISLFLRPGDPALALSDSDGTLELWAPRPLRRLRRVPTRGSTRSEGTAMIEFSPDGSAFVLADLAGGLSLHDGKTGAPRKTLRSPLKPAAPQTSSGYHFQMAFQPGGKAFAVTELHGDIALYDTKSGVLRSTLRPAGASELLSVDVEFGKKSNILASVSGLNGDLWDTDTGQHIVSLPGLRAAYWSPDGGLIAWQKGDDEVVITDGRTGEIRQTLRLKGVSYYRWSPDSRYLVATQGETILLLRASDGAQLRLVLLGPADQPTLLAASGDGSRTLDGLAISCLGERAPGSPPPLADPGLLRDFLADKPQASRP